MNVFIVLEYFQLTGVSGRVFPALYPLPNVTDYLMPPPFSPSHVTDYLDILSRIVVVSSFDGCMSIHLVDHAFFLKNSLWSYWLD